MTEASQGTDGAGKFVGREPELAVLLNGLEQARDGRGGLVLLAGEPGIGKSRLADELTLRARETGAGVLWGKCWDGGGAPAYWPWVQCLRAFVRTRPAEVIRDHLTGCAAVAQILPELRSLVADAPEAPPADPDSARFRLFDATANFLRAAASSEPLVIVIDDLQAADTPSLLLLRFLASQLSDSGVLITATYRDVELSPAHPLTGALAEIVREPRTQLVHLSGLGVHDVATLAQRRLGLDPSPELVTELHRQTGGNPLFVGEAIKLLATEGALGVDPDAAALRFAIPGAVRDVILRRLDHLNPGSREVLTLSAVLGPEPTVETLAPLAELSTDQLLEALDEAIRSGLMLEVRGALGRYRFSHDLIREVLYDELSPARRIRLHLRTAEILANLHQAGSDRHLGEIAHHYFEAGPAADPTKLREFAVRAAEYAAQQLAYEEAVRLYRMALQAMELDDSADDVARGALLLELGDAQMRAGETPRAKDTFLGAAAIARRLDLPEHLARAALGYGGRFVWARAANDRHIVPLLQDALNALGEGDTLLRARVLARLAGALRDQPSPVLRDDLSREAVDLARRLGDPATLAYALDGRYSAIWAPDTDDERLVIADEIVRIAEAERDLERAVQGHHYRLCVFLERGDIAAVRAELELNARLADELRQPAQRWYIRATKAVLALLEGRFGEAESLIDEAFAEGRQAESMHAFGVVLVQQYWLRREQGRAAELEDALRGSIEEYSFWAWMRGALLHLYHELGYRAETRSLYETIAAQDFADLPWDNDWLMGVSLLADVVVSLRDQRRASVLYELLIPYWDRSGYGHPEFAMGSMSRPLGMLAALLGRLDDAEHHFEQALEMNERMGAWPWVAHTQRDYADMLLARAGPGDRQRATGLAGEARGIAERLGMAALSRRLDAMALDDAGPEVPTPAIAAPASTATFRREGEYWTIAFGEDSFRLRDAKGLRYLARLLAEPGRELLALDLARSEPASPAKVREEDMRISDLGDAGALLDEQATQAYRARLHELQAELDEAESWNDAERAERARSEMDFIARELSRAIGLGGRQRSAGSASERARVAVTRAVRSAMSRIAEHSAPLGDHLEATIHTGTYCAYRPDPRAAIRWQA